MDEIAKLKLFIQEFENSNTPLTKPKPTKQIDKKPVEVKQEEVMQELPQAITQTHEIQEVKPEKKKRIKSPAQLEALKKAQEVRKANIEKGKKQKEYESALKLLEYLQTEKEEQRQSKSKATKQYKNKKVESESESELESEEEQLESEDEGQIQKQREMKSMKNKKYSNTSQQSYKPKYNFFAD